MTGARHLGLALLLLACAPCAAADPLPASGETLDLRGDGRIVGLAAGRAMSLIQPEFRSATVLRDELLALGDPDLAGLAVSLVTPRVAVAPPPGTTKAPPPRFSRLLLQGPAPAVRRARTVLRQLDAPPRAVRICMRIAEVAGTERCQHGADGLFARDDASDGRFRGVGIDFRPEDYLREQLTGIRPFEGHSLRLGDPLTAGGRFEYTLRALERHGEAWFVARPSLRLTEGVPAYVESINQIPQLLLNRVSRDGENLDLRVRDAAAGLRMRLTAVKIGADEAVIDVDLWLGIPEATDEPGAPIGSTAIKQRQVKTRLRVRDRQSMLFGGLVLRRRGRVRTGPPAPSGLLDPVLSSVSRRGTRTEIWFLVHPIIEWPRIDPEGATHHARSWRDEGGR